MKNNISKIYLKNFIIACVSIVFALSLTVFIGKQTGLASHIVSACQSHDLIGYAWSDNIGWISFSCENSGNQHTVNYGVDKEGNGNLIGYAWSDNIGWIDFNPQSGYPSAPNQSAKITGNSVKGWARALSYGGGWDGWIKLNPQYGGVTMNTSVGEFEGYAFGGDDTDSEAIIGWISFNCNTGGPNGSNICESYNYKVKLSNLPPEASISCNPGSCSGFSGVPQGANGSLEVVYSATDTFDSQNDLTCALKVKDNLNTSVIDINTDCNTNNILVSGLRKGNYTAEVTATDTNGLTDIASMSFTLKQDIVAQFECSLDNSTFKDCSTLEELLTSDIIYFNPDTSIISNGSTTITNWSWDFNNDGIEDSALQYPNTNLTKIGDNIVTLTITDNNSFGSRSDSETETLNIKLPLPDFEEVPSKD